MHVEILQNRTTHLSLVLFITVVLFGFSFTWAHAATTATLLPNGEGTNLSWTPSAGATHYTLVDETVCNGTTDYVSETTVGDRDSYTVSLSTIANGSTITNIALKPCASRNSTGGGSATFNVFYRYNGTASADAGAYALPTGTTPATLSTTTFSGLSLLKGSTSTLQIGGVYSAGTKGVRLSRMATVVTYTPPAYSQSSYYSQAAYYSQGTYYSQGSYYSQGVYYSQGAYYSQSGYGFRFGS